MKVKHIFLFVSLITLSTFAQINNCGISVNNTFDGTGDLPENWVEYNTSGRIVVESGKLKINHNTDQPSVYHQFTPTSENPTFSFEVSASRASVNCQVHLISSTGKYISSVALGNGAATIKFATAMSNNAPSNFREGVPVVNFPTNTVFTIKSEIDFTTKTIDFYINGTLVKTNAPFLEAAEDASKMDIQLLFMYADNGQFYFDNISLLGGDKNRRTLTNNINTYEGLLSSASIGNAFRQYPQSAADAFEQVINTAKTVSNDCDALAETIKTKVTDLESAKTLFLSSLIDPDVLTLYSAYSFSGEEKEMKSGYYNGGLGDFDDKTTSFKLKKGYMTTFAQNVNGTGVSKVYIASEEDLEINLPAELQETISFIRVGPWRDTLKKGSSGKSSTNDVTLALNTSWFYDWGNADTDIEGNEYVVMNWGGTPGLAAMERLGKQLNTTHHLAFNEPDGAKQANMTVDVAIARYATLQASGLRLGAPAVTDGTKGRAWLDEFMTKAIAAGYRIDFIPVHYYKIQSSSGFRSWLKNFYDEYHIPIWVTEFNYGDIWAPGEKTKTEAQVLTNIKAYCEMMDDAEFIERYCIFTWQPSETSSQTIMSVRNPVVLNSVGEFYANHESPIAYTQEIYEQGEKLSIDNNLIESEISIYPTVIKDGFLNIVYSDKIKNSDTELSVYNTFGQLVKKVSISSNSINISELSSGVYIVKIASELGYYTDKFIIQ